jgi:hypothetical protein
VEGGGAVALGRVDVGFLLEEGFDRIAVALHGCVGQACVGAGGGKEDRY